MFKHILAFHNESLAVIKSY